MYNKAPILAHWILMAIHSILRIGDPRLLQTAREVTDFKTATLDTLISDMLDTMKAENGAGLAAPQIGIDLRVVVFGFENNPRYPEAISVPQTVLINPLIKPLSSCMEENWEGCLSVPGMRGMVSRFSEIEYQGFDAEGTPIHVQATGFHARVVQHECDHLDGILYPQRMTDFSRFGFIEELETSGQLQRQACDDDSQI